MNTKNRRPSSRGRRGAPTLDALAWRTSESDPQSRIPQTPPTDPNWNNRRHELAKHPALPARWINEGIAARLGGLHSAHVLMDSLDFAPIAQLQHSGKWREAGELLAESAKRLERGGAKGTHRHEHHAQVADQVQAATSLPVLAIADSTGVKLKADGVKRVALLGTKFTMEQPFYRSRLEERFGVEVLVPNTAERETVHRVIYDELCHGQVRESSRVQYLEIIDRLRDAQAPKP